jgi:hypothetical protein
MRKAATLIATLMLGVASCAYAQGGPPDGIGGGGGPPGIGGGAPGGGGPDGGPPAAQGPGGGASEGRGGGEGGEGPSVDRAAPPSDASEGPPTPRAESPARARSARQKSGEDSDAGPASKGDGPKSSRRERRADDGDDAKDAGDKPKKADVDDKKSRERAADKADEKESQDLTKGAEDAVKQKKDDVTDKDAGPARKDADTAGAVKPERAKQVDLSGDKRDRVQSAFRNKGDVKHRTDVDIDISVGRRLPRHWDFVPVPLVVVEIVPEYRDYVFVWVEDEYVICDPVTYEVVAVIPASGREHAGSSGSGKCPARLTLSEDEEALILRSVRLGREVNVDDLEVGWSVPGDIELREFPSEVLSEADELSGCRYFVADDELAVVDPEEDRVVLLIDKS